MTPLSLFLISDRNYLQHTTVTLCSVLTHLAPACELEIFLLSGNLEESDLAPVRELAPIHPFRLRLVKPDLSVFQNLPDLKGTRMTYLRLLIPELFPELDSAVYLDSDIIAEGDISPLWEIVPRNFSLGAVAENQKLPFIQARKAALGIAPDRKYFNAGVLWLNLKKLREIHFAEKMQNYVRENPEKIVFHDQDILNAVLKDDWFSLPRCWNCLTDPQNFDDAEYRATLTEPVRILHYAGYLMAPWLFCCKSRKRERYYHYLARTSFKGYVPPKDLRVRVLYFLPVKWIPAVYNVLKTLHLR